LISSIERKGTLRRQRKIKQIQLGHKLDPPLPRNDDLTENCIHAISVKYIIQAVYSNERVMAPPQERGVILVARKLVRHITTLKISAVVPGWTAKSWHCAGYSTHKRRAENHRA
jgi:hypothetical protein